MPKTVDGKHLMPGSLCVLVVWGPAEAIRKLADRASGWLDDEGFVAPNDTPQLFVEVNPILRGDAEALMTRVSGIIAHAHTRVQRRPR